MNYEYSLTKTIGFIVGLFHNAFVGTISGEDEAKQ
jgi:hypothetical protein